MTMNHGRKIGGLLACLAILCSLAVFLPSCKVPTDEEIRKSMEVIGLDSKWVAKEYRQWPHPKLILVPAITFQIRNLTAEPMRFVNFNAIFKEVGARENRGDCFLAAIRKKPVLPGELSDVITMKSNFGVEGTNLDSFKNNPGWQTYSVKLFAQSKGSRHVLLGEWIVSRKIDFKEDQPVHMGGEKKEPDRK
jgi:hypothetical protein